MKLKNFYDQCIRVLKVTKKPNTQEFLTTAKISGLGLLVIGAMGFLLFVIKEALF